MKFLIENFSFYRVSKDEQIEANQSFNNQNKVYARDDLLHFNPSMCNKN